MRFAVLAVVMTVLAPRVGRAECRVRVVEAPPGVAEEIESWVSNEPKCIRALDVRVERGAFGLHIIATDDSGRVRERVVQDSQSAAVLIVSWMADDSLDEPATPDETTSFVAPAERADEPPLARVLQASVAGVTHWFTVGFSLTDDGYGFRGQVDVLAVHHWRFGVGGGWRSDGEDTPDRDTGPHASSGLSDATIFAAYIRSVGPFDVRAQVGAGVNVDARSGEMDMRENRTMVAPELDAAVLLALRLGAHWGVLAGPLLDVEHDNHVPVELSAFVGVERGL